MTEENKKANIREELEEADTALREAEGLQALGLYKGAVGRAYYHALHCARALLLSLGIEPKTHSGVASPVALRFVRSGRLHPEIAAVLSSLEADRFSGEYERGVFTEQMAEHRLAEARQYADAVRSILQADGYLDPR